MVHKIMENNPDTLYRYGFPNYDKAVYRRQSYGYRYYHQNLLPQMGFSGCVGRLKTRRVIPRSINVRKHL